MGNMESAWPRKVIFGFVPWLAIVSSIVAGTPSDKKIYQDPREPMERRVQDLLSRMTLAEKLSQMMSRTPTPLPRFGLEAYDWSGQACHSINAKTGKTRSEEHTSELQSH